MRSIRVAIILAIYLAVMSSSSVSASANFRQQILPMDCIFEIVDNGSGELRFLTPAECGQAIPTKPPLSTSFAPYDVLPYANLERGVGRLINLDLIELFHSLNGYDTVVGAGDIYYFVPRQRDGAAMFTTWVYVKSITESRVHFVVTWKGEVALGPGQKVGFDTNANGLVDFTIAVGDILDDSRAEVKFAFYESPLVVQSENRGLESTHLLRATITIIVLATSLIIACRRKKCNLGQIRLVFGKKNKE